MATTRARRLVIVTALATTAMVACAREGLIDPDWPDAPEAPTDAAAPPPAPSETCTPRRDPSCLAASQRVDLVADPEGLGRVALVGGVAGDATRAWVLVSHPLLGDASTSWVVERIVDGGRESSVGPLAIGEMGTAYWARGALDRAADGRLLATWRTSVDDGAFHETQGAYVDGDVAEPIAPLHRLDVRAGWGSSYGTPAIITLAGRTYVASPIASGIAATPLDFPGEPVLVVQTESPAQSLVARAIDETRIAFVWIEDGAIVERSVHGAVLDVATGTSLSAQIFAPRRFGPYRAALVVSGDTLRIAAFRADPASLREGHVVLAHLDATLARVEPDREVRGWGGLATDELDAVVLGGEPWLFVRTNDVRLPAQSALYAVALDDAACVDRVAAPLAVLPHLVEIHVDRGDLRAFAIDDVAWIALGRAATTDTVSVIRVSARACR